MTARNLRRLLRLTAFAGLSILIASCAKRAPMDALRPEGPIAEQADNLFRPVFWIATAIFVLVQALLIIAIVKFRDRGQDDEPKQIHGNSKLEFAWTLAPALILAGIAIPTVLTIFDMSSAREPGDLRVKVVGHQWWWEYRYQDLDPELVTANELVIPTNRQVFLELESADVIHSFWVPKLAGKQDVVPERTNTMKLLATKPGEYYGACAEFCAVSHANMRLRVIAKEPAEFERWLRDQQRPAADTAGDAARGEQLFVQNCAACHAVRGTDAAGQAAPELTHLASRGTFAAATYDLNAENLFRWIQNSREMKPGVTMPVFGKMFGGPLSDEDIRLIVTFLLGLK